jgi:hypothetical protein
VRGHRLEECLVELAAQQVRHRQPLQAALLCLGGRVAIAARPCSAAAFGSGWPRALPLLPPPLLLIAIAAGAAIRLAVVRYFCLQESA